MSRPTNQLANLKIHEAADLLKRREVSAVELTRAVIDEIERREADVGAYITVTPDIALSQAADADARLSRGAAASPLDGIPMAVKDNLCTEGVKTTCGSRMLANFVPPYTSTVVQRLWNAGAVMVGKANMDEFAMGSSTEHSAFKQTANPWDLSRVPGGSSGGSAAAVAANEALFALGSDTGGSVRLPASFCGVVGLKPTYGLVSRYGLVAFASSLDQIGPLTRDVTDTALVMNVIAGHDPFDATSLDVDVPDYRQSLVPDVRGLRLGVPREYFVEGMHPGVASTVRAAIDRLAELGAIVEECTLPHTSYALAAYYVIAPAEASANLARYDGVRYGLSVRDGDLIDSFSRSRDEGFGAEVKRRIMIGTYALSSGYYDAYYLQAQKVRTLVKRDFDEAFARYDALLVPTCPTVAFKLGERVDDPVSMYLSDVCTVTVNCAGIPGLVVPCGLVDDMPVGLQILGPALGEATLLRIGYAFEQSVPPLRRPD
jgi:aspartyl-tRNA(Asn)/glutamyl-tRNA(Gln) amidotransferase subunit A